MVFSRLRLHQYLFSKDHHYWIRNVHLFHWISFPQINFLLIQFLLCLPSPTTLIKIFFKHEINQKHDTCFDFYSFFSISPFYGIILNQTVQIDWQETADNVFTVKNYWLEKKST